MARFIPLGHDRKT